MKSLRISIAVLLTSSTLLAQSGMKATDYTIHDNNNGDGVLITDAYKLEGVVKTPRKKDGAKLVFDQSSTWNQYGKESFVDGYAKSNVDGGFVFPVGSEGVYAPIALDNAKGATVGYTHQGIEHLDAISDAIDNVARVGYWNVYGTEKSRVAFSYSKDSGIEEIVQGDLERLIIIGWNGKQWIPIESSLDTFGLKGDSAIMNSSAVASDLFTGSISSNDLIDFSQINTFAFGAAAKDGAIVEVKNFELGRGDYRLLKSIHFPYNDKELTQYSTNLMNKLVASSELRDGRVRLVGHTDYLGSDDYNYDLGMDRAETVMSFMLDAGISDITMGVESRGEHEPKIDCEGCSSKEMVLNRRVDIYVLN